MGLGTGVRVSSLDLQVTLGRGRLKSEEGGRGQISQAPRGPPEQQVQQQQHAATAPGEFPKARMAERS